ncbi:MAG: two-component sensor histidine kinase, partial [Desulfobacterales bacterium]|nr:two-component sensor histidine kinase [Desulfobacterales bacterium]
LEQANLEIKKAQENIIRAEKLATVGRLASGIAHEIGNPLGIIMGYLELLKQEDILREDKQDYIKRAENELTRIDIIIRQLLDIARPQLVHKEPISVHGVIEDMVHILKVQPIMSTIHIHLNLQAMNDVIVADANQLRQVFLNLAINAADAILLSQEKGKGELNISTELLPPNDANAIDQQSTLYILYEDNGHGISNENLPNIFDPFFTTKPPGKGTGIGLSVCFMIIESISGHIHAQSTVGKGTQMNIFLPIYHNNPSSQVE